MRRFVLSLAILLLVDVHPAAAVGLGPWTPAG